jgi:hypothetical protein
MVALVTALYATTGLTAADAGEAPMVVRPPSAKAMDAAMAEILRKAFFIWGILSELKCALLCTFALFSLGVEPLIT